MLILADGGQQNSSLNINAAHAFGGTGRTVCVLPPDLVMYTKSGVSGGKRASVMEPAFIDLTAKTSRSAPAAPAPSGNTRWVAGGPPAGRGFPGTGCPSNIIAIFRTDNFIFS